MFACVCVLGGVVLSWMICVGDPGQCGPCLLKIQERWSVIALVFQHFHTLFRTVSSPAHFFSSLQGRSLSEKENNPHLGKSFSAINGK